jgi:DNA-binding NarL/FixJ family response regulator
MKETILLVIGVITVIVGIIILLRERENKYHHSQEELFNLLERIELKIDRVIEEVEEGKEILSKDLDNKDLLLSSVKEPVEKEKTNKELNNKIIKKHKEIYNLYKNGFSAKEIAIKLNRGLGEVETIIALLNYERDNNG